MADELLAKLAGIVDLDEQTKANIAGINLLYLLTISCWVIEQLLMCLV